MQASHSITALALTALLTSWINCLLAASPSTYYLGYLSSAPDAAIPDSLATEWKYAFQVAVELLNSETDSFQLTPLSESSGCDFESAQNAAGVLIKHEELIGVVGPACSEAAMSAAKFLQKSDVPLVSFAATASRLSDRNMYPNFFRTVYSDEDQASAIVATVNQLQMMNITVVYTNDVYSLPLARRIQELAKDNVFRMQLLELGGNGSINSRELEGMFNSIEPFSFVVLAVQPAVAKKIWELVAQLGKSSFPWWYLGSDGVTAIDATTQGNALQGEVGLAPYGGDSSDDLLCQKFYQHWSKNGYPGLSNRSISYVPYLFDAVQSFFYAVDKLHKAGTTVTGPNVLSALGTTSHKGCTGGVQFDPATGSRLLSPGQFAVYDFVSYIGDSWQLKGRISNGNFSSLQPLQRPGTFPVNGEMYAGDGSGGHHGKVNKALVAAIAVFSTAFILVSVTFLCYHKIRSNSPMAFFRMSNRSPCSV